MKMFDKNGQNTMITRMVLDSNMERLRAGHSPMAIVESLHEQVKLIDYNGHFTDKQGHKTQQYWTAFKKGWFAYQHQTRPVRIIASEMLTTKLLRLYPKLNPMDFELNRYLSAYEFAGMPKDSARKLIVGTIAS